MHIMERHPPLPQKHHVVIVCLFVELYSYVNGHRNCLDEHLHRKLCISAPLMHVLCCTH